MKPEIRAWSLSPPSLKPNLLDSTKFCLFYSSYNYWISPLFRIPLVQALFVSHAIIAVGSELVFLVPVFPLLTPILSPHQHFSNLRGHRFPKILPQPWKAYSICMRNFAAKSYILFFMVPINSYFYKGTLRRGNSTYYTSRNF